jgi:hypothetical protein
MQILSQMSAKVVRFDDATRILGVYVECTQLLMDLIDRFEAFVSAPLPEGSPHHRRSGGGICARVVCILLNPRRRTLG